MGCVSHDRPQKMCILRKLENWDRITQSCSPEDYIAEKGFKSKSHYNLVHKFIPVPQAMKIPDAKAAVDKDWTSRSCQHGHWIRYRAINMLFWKHKKRKIKVHFVTLMDVCVISRVRSLNPNFRSVKDESCSEVTF